MRKLLKRVVSLSLALVMILALTVTAQAADLNYAIYNLNAEEGYTLIPKTAGDQADAKVTEDGVDYYKQTVKFDFSFSGTESQYAVFLLSDGAKVPSANTIRYINQDTGKVTYNIYPDSLAKAGTYTVCVSGSDVKDGYVEAATFEVKMLYTLGDVNQDGSITSLDAAIVLQHVARLTTLDGTAMLAADVDGNPGVTSLDAAVILQKVARLIDVFPAEQ